jgi:phage tail-like protein
MTIDNGSGDNGAGNDGPGGAPDEATSLPVPVAPSSPAPSSPAPPSPAPTSPAMVVTGPGAQAFVPGGRRPDWLVGQLPVGMLDDDFFYRFVSIFQEEAGTYLDDIDNLPNIIDPAVAPPSMVRFMAAWLALPALNPTLDVAYQRRFLQDASKLIRWRGTRLALKGMLELITGGQVEVSDSGGVFRLGEGGERHAEVTVRVESTGWLPEAAFLEFVKDEVPANVRVGLAIGEREVWSLDAGDGAWGDGG